MSDLDIIRKIEQKLGVSLSQTLSFKWDTKGYFSAQDGRVIGLGLGNCSISDLNLIIDELNSLPQLIQLYLSSNQISDLYPLKNFNKLTVLALENNKIENLPPWIIDFDMDVKYKGNAYEYGYIHLSGNPIKFPPLEIIQQGKESIRRYLEQIKEEGIDYIYEAKLILVGEGSSGKTSLQMRLKDAKAVLPTSDNRTRGIKIEDWVFKTDQGKNHIAHIWDFGGQDVYYPVHRFFLTENSVFVLLASTRQTHHNFDYWIPTIYQFGGASPIILGQTCHEGNKAPWNDLGYYLGNPNFLIIRAGALVYHELNLLNSQNSGLAEIRQTIIQQLTGLPHYGKGVPKSWVTVREKITIEAKFNACIPYKDFRTLCRQVNPGTFADTINIEDCARFMHSIGIILWYAENETLRDWVVLQPEWAMNAVYKIIDDDIVQQQNGIITTTDFQRLWRDECYKENHIILKQMLEVFKIAFPKKHIKGNYMLPARLASMPTEDRWPANSSACA